MNGALGVAGIFLLDDGPHLARGLATRANDAPIAGRVSHVQRQQRQPLAVTFSQQSRQGVNLRQRYVARQHQRNPVVGQQRQRLLYGMPRAQLWLLPGKFTMKWPASASKR